MADWDISSPDDSGIVSQFPANERAARAAVMANFGVEHHEEDDANIGKHELVTLLDQGSDPTIPAGQVGIYNVGGVLKTRSGSGAATRADAFPAGTLMVFRQASAPTGWTQDTSLNDRVLRVVSGAGGGVGGSWTISGLSVNGHAITVDEMPAHSHSITVHGGYSDHIVVVTSRNTASITGPGTLYTNSSGGGAAHTHGLTADGAWRPLYTDVIVASKN